MNNPAAAVLITFLLIMITLNPAPTAARRPPLYDTHGNLVHAGTQYLIVPATYYHGGGVTLAGAPTTHHNRSAAFHVDIIQSNDPNSHGLPVTFHPIAKNKVIIFGAMDLNIQFAQVSSNWAKSTVWKVMGGSHHEGKTQFLQAGGGDTETPSWPTARNSFKIFRVKPQGKKGPVLFRIVFCSATCEECHVSCTDVGIFVDPKTGARRLALTDHGPLLVQFKKV